MKLSSHPASQFQKLIYIGDSSTGKTGSLVSLVKSGYKLRILDYDNGLQSLIAQIEEQCPDFLDNVDAITLRDKFRATSSGPVVSAKAYVEGVKYLDKWDDGSTPSDWGPETIFVLDTTTSMGKSCFEWAKSLAPTAKDPRQWYFAAQQSFENIIAQVTSEDFRCNVILIGHVNYKELQDGTTKGYPTAVGSALGPLIPRYFNTMLMTETVGSGKSVRRTIRTISTAVVDLKNPAPFKIDAEYPLNEGLALIFAKLNERKT